MLKQALIFATVLSLLLVGGIAGFSFYQQKQQFANVRSELATLQKASEEQSARASAQVAALQAELTNSQARIEALIQEKEQVTQAQSQMENQMRSALQSRDVTISELQGKLTVNILDRVLFDSGEAQLKPEGEAVLSQVAEVLNAHTNRQIYVIGHTDNVPIRATPFSRYGSNWELSTARATAAVRYLTEKAKVDPRKLAAVGYGEYHPVADNSTLEGRAKNRRIAIVILPETFNPLDMNTNAAPASATNSLPASPAPVVDSESDAVEAAEAVEAPPSK